MMTGSADDIFVDTNVLVFAAINRAPFHDVAYTTLRELRQRNLSLWISRQVIREYLAVLTRPQSFSQPLASPVAAQGARRLIQQFHVVDEDATTTALLLQLMESLAIGGKQVHDANIVATMQAHGIGRLLTHNVGDFARYAQWITVLPLTDGRISE